MTILQIKKILFAIKNKCFLFCLKNNIWPSVEHLSIVKSINYDYVLDVGANKGQFSLLVLSLSHQSIIKAFEPVSSSFEKLKIISKKYSRFECIKAIVHENNNPQKINVTTSSDNSSLLLASQDQINFSKGRAILKSYELVNAVSLYEIIEKNKTHKILLKVDVQGTELEVLRSAKNHLKFINYIIVECSHIQLYEGQNLWLEIDQYLKNLGFSNKKRYNDQYYKGKLIQSDYLYKKINE